MASLLTLLANSQKSSKEFFAFFVKVIGSSLHPINLSIGMDFTAMVLLGIVKRDPEYVRNRRSLEVASYFCTCIVIL